MTLKLASRAALLFGLIGVSLPLHASKRGSVTFNVCNAGKADIDALLLQGSKVSTSHVGAADCVSVAQTEGAMEPAYIGFAFADSKGQWGATHRIDVLPDLGSLRSLLNEGLAFLGRKPLEPGQPVLSAANQTALVRHAGKDVSLPLQ